MASSPRRLYNDIDKGWSKSSQPHSEFSGGVFFSLVHSPTGQSQSINQSTGRYETMTSHRFAAGRGARCACSHGSRRTVMVVNRARMTAREGLRGESGKGEGMLLRVGG